MWCVPRLDDEYIERMEDVLKLYEKPYDSAEPVVCLDEKPVQLLDDVRKSKLARGCILHRDYEYRRCGTANLFCGVEPKGGRHFTKATKTRDRFEFARMLREIADAYPDAELIHLVVDNLSTHSRNALVAAFGEDGAEQLWSRFRVHFTPKHGSWLNPAEIEISLVSRECLGNRRLGTLARLSSETRTWNRDANRRRRTIDWRFTRRDARKTFGYDRPRSCG
jgi:transposase